MSSIESSTLEMRPSSRRRRSLSRDPKSFSAAHEDTRIYLPALRSKEREIRLLTLIPGFLHEPIRATLKTVSLKNSPNYEALSYVWGDPNDTRPISLNGQTFHVTENLKAALLRLRRTTEKRIFWIDAICVNQLDLQERSSQVALMAEIYGNCESCTAWLGEQDDNTGQAVDMLNSIAPGGHVHNWPCFSAEVRTSLGAHQKSHRDMKRFLESHHEILKPLGILFRRPFWSRAWTVQEVILPKVVTVKCGSFEIDRQILFSVRTVLAYHFDGCCSSFFQAIGSGDYEAYIELRDVISGLQVSSSQHCFGGCSSLCWLLDTHRDRDANDPKDKVYAFLSMCEAGIRAKIVADYTAQVPDCYAQVMEYAIMQWDGLRALQYASLDTTMPDLPSWIADWSTSSEEQRSQKRRLDLYVLYDAGRGSKIHAVVSPQSRTLSLQGIYFEPIAAVGDTSSNTEQSIMAALQGWYAIWQEYRGQSAMVDGHTCRAFLKTLMLDSVDSFEPETDDPSYNKPPARAEERHIDAGVEWWALACEEDSFFPHLEMEPGPKAEAMELVTRNLAITIKHRRFFVTSNSFIGIGPTSTQVGDQIWIACGGNMPLILRPVNNTTSCAKASDVRPHHRLVGSCYVDGIMDGEAAEGLLENKVEIRLI